MDFKYGAGDTVLDGANFRIKRLSNGKYHIDCVGGFPNTAWSDLGGTLLVTGTWHSEFDIR